MGPPTMPRRAGRRTGSGSRSSATAAPSPRARSARRRTSSSSMDRPPSRASSLDSPTTAATPSGCRTAPGSPDGASIACRGTAEAIGAGARNTRVWRFARGGGAGIDLLGEWDRTTGSRVMSDIRGETAPLPPAWTRAGRILFIGSDQGTANLYSVSADGGDVRAETLGAHQLVTASVDREIRCFAGVVATATSPGEVVTGQPGHGMRTITTLNGALLEARYVAAPERVEFTGADGWTIEGWLLLPRGFDPAKRWPLVLEVHGGPHGAYGYSFFHEFQVLAGRGDAGLYLNPPGSQAYGDP